MISQIEERYQMSQIKGKKHKTRAQLEQEVKDLEREKKEREESDKKQVAIADAWSRQDPNGDRY